MIRQIKRAPVVTVLGHVDHGKTSLLDYIRSTNIATSEEGGITQQICAYQVNHDDLELTFIDTPGHAAFTAMRASGAKATDVVILVVAADDGVLPQTIEAISHAKVAKVPMIVAINKIDKQGVDIDRVRTDLSHHGVVPEEWGGDHMFVPISAKTGEGIDSLLESVLLVSEMLDLTARPVAPGQGVVIDSRISRGSGPIVTVLVENGTLRKGDPILVGPYYGRVRALVNDIGKQIVSAGPSMPVEVLGLDCIPSTGDEFNVELNEKNAREMVAKQKNKNPNKTNQTNPTNQTNKTTQTTQNVVLKADVQGSLDAIRSSLEELETKEVKIEVVYSGLGGITGTDANIAFTSDAILIGFNVRADASASEIIDTRDLDLRYYSVIYQLLDDIKNAMNVTQEWKEEIVGVADVREVFTKTKTIAIAGCMVVEGRVYRSNKVRVRRDNVVIYEGELESLRRFKDDVAEVRNGMECGIGVRYNDVKVGDKIEVLEEGRK